jgi:hypothetical protein
MTDWQFHELISYKNTDWRKVRLKGPYEEFQRIALLRKLSSIRLLIMAWFKLEVKAK